jgi:hypothetical protein
MAGAADDPPSPIGVAPSLMANIEKKFITRVRHA